VAPDLQLELGWKPGEDCELFERRRIDAHVPVLGVDRDGVGRRHDEVWQMGWSL